MTSLILPDTDRELSRQTGWVRAHWEALADHLLDSLVPYFSPGASLVELPGRPSRSGTASDALEGFARSFMLAAFRIAGVQGKGCEQLIERYARGVANGANPDHPEAWLRLTPRSQQMVEAAAIAVSLHETREWIWDRLDPRAQEHVAEWLGGFNNSTTHDNNWRLFQVVTEQFLASVGGGYRQAEIDAGLDRIEDWYVGNGWYSDGDGQNFDNYIGWAMHLYPGLWARMAAATPGAQYEDRLKLYKERIKLFLDDAVHLVGPHTAGLRVLAAFLPLQALTDALLTATRGYRMMRPTVLLDRVSEQFAKDEHRCFAAAVDDDGVIEQCAVAIRRSGELRDELREQLHVQHVHLRHLLDPLRVVAVVGERVMRIGHADLRVGAVAGFAGELERHHARDVALHGQ